MKFVAAALALALLPCWAAAGQERAFVKFYRRANPAIQTEYIQEIVQSTQRWATRAGLQNQVDTLLCMAHRESALDMTADDGLGRRRSLGIYQTREQYQEKLTFFWAEQGYALGDLGSIDSQCALGVAEFYLQLVKSEGLVYTAVRSYNGSGPSARRYAHKVFVSRKVIFGRPYKAGERIAVPVLPNFSGWRL